MNKYKLMIVLIAILVLFGISPALSSDGTVYGDLHKSVNSNDYGALSEQSPTGIAKFVRKNEQERLPISIQSPAGKYRSTKNIFISLKIKKENSEGGLVTSCWYSVVSEKGEKIIDDNYIECKEGRAEGYFDLAKEGEYIIKAYAEYSNDEVASDSSTFYIDLNFEDELKEETVSLLEDSASLSFSAKENNLEKKENAFLFNFLKKARENIVSLFK